MIKSVSIQVSAGLFLLFVTFESLKLYFEAKADYKRMEQNYIVSKQEAEHFKTLSGDNALKVTVQEMTIKELRNTIPSVVRDLKNMYIRPSSVKSYVKAGSEIKTEIKVQLKDTIVYSVDSIPMKSKTINYREKWFSVTGTIYQDTARLSIAARDTITAVIYSQRKHPFWWILSKKQTKCVITNKNPFVIIDIKDAIVVR